ncbi:uncharacterized protein LOC134667714 [Cydia fagiglandana]|uniref:uncharacterized protein LOC134667714 n=1 Tax=Cydia fagiglandana TaxID=1458189 RepID=UPI002FEE4DE2
MLTKKSTNNRRIIICGDFNIDLFKSNLDAAKQLEATLLSYNFKLQINEPTRITERSSTCIDNIATNFDIEDTPKVHHLNLSDHSAQVIEIPANIRLTQNSWYIQRRDYSKTNCNKFRECLNSLSFAEVLNCNDCKLAFNLFHDDILLYFKLCFPLISVRVRSNKKLNWVTKRMKTASKTKRNLFMQLVNTKNKNDKKKIKSHYKNYSRIFKKCIRQAQKNENTNLVSNAGNVAQASWNIINAKLGKDKPNQMLDDMNFKGETLSNPQDITNAFNKQFLNMEENESHKPDNFRKDNIKFNSSTIYLKPTDQFEITKVIKSLRNSKSCGYDELMTSVIKENAEVLALPLSHLINLSMMQGTFPDKLKISIIKPVFKKGDKRHSDNYRPIALIPIISKVFERVMYSRMLNFFDRFDVLSNRQFGFRKNRSTTSAILELLEDIAESREKRLPVTAIFMDMSKAFDYVQHNILLDKLHKYGIRGICADWIESYLVNRQQLTETTKYCPKTQTIVKFHSDVEIVKQGVPQGSILGPLLFLIYINDLPNITKHKVTLFADDCSVVVCCKDPATYELEVNTVFHDINVWLENNMLRVNLNKTNYIEFHAPQGNPTNINIMYKNVKIHSATSLRFLGVMIDCHNSWEVHVEHLIKKLTRFIFALRRLRNIASRQASIWAFHGHIMSNLRYGIILWGNCKDINRVFKLQKKCVRAICSARSRDSCLPLFKELQILTVPSLYVYEICLYVKKNLHKFNIQKSNPRITSKLHGFNLCYPIDHKTAYFRKSVFYMSVHTFNHLPNEIKILEQPELGRKLYKWCLEKSYYKISDHFMSSNNN